MNIGNYGWDRNTDYFNSNIVFLTEPAPPTSNYGILNIGTIPFDGKSTGHFVGSSSGTQLAINVDSAYIGNYLNLQVGGSSKALLEPDTFILHSIDSTRPIFAAIKSNGAWGGTFFNPVLGNTNTGCNGSDSSSGKSAFGVAGVLGGIVYIGGTGGGRASFQVNATSLIIPMVIQAAVSQNTSLQEWQNSSTSIQSLVSKPGNSANYGIFSIGTSAWDGATSGKFVGSASGTQLAVNAASGYTGNLLDLQVAGIRKFVITSAGKLAITTATNGMLFTGQTSDNTLALATFTAGRNMVITNSEHSISIAAIIGGPVAAATDYLAAAYMFT